MQVRWIDVCLVYLLMVYPATDDHLVLVLGLPVDSAARLVPVLFCCFCVEKLPHTC
jgi:hypothetical protein